MDIEPALEGAAKVTLCSPVDPLTGDTVAWLFDVSKPPTEKDAAAIIPSAAYGPSLGLPHLSLADTVHVIVEPAVMDLGQLVKETNYVRESVPVRLSYRIQRATIIDNARCYTLTMFILFLHEKCR